MGPNTLAAFLDMVRTGHHYLKLNETASKVASVVRGIQKEFSNFDILHSHIQSNLTILLPYLRSNHPSVNTGLG